MPIGDHIFTLNRIAAEQGSGQNMKQLWNAVVAHPDLKGFDAKHVVKGIETALVRSKNDSIEIGAEHVLKALTDMGIKPAADQTGAQIGASAVEALKQNLTGYTRASTGAAGSRYYSPSSPSTTLTGTKTLFGIKFSELSTEQKVSGGLSLALAGMLGIASMGSLANMVERDEHGNAHMQWSQVGMALCNAAIAAGCGYLGYRTLTQPMYR